MEFECVFKSLNVCFSLNSNICIWGYVTFFSEGNIIELNVQGMTYNDIMYIWIKGLYRIVTDLRHNIPPMVVKAETIDFRRFV